MLNELKNKLKNIDCELSQVDDNIYEINDKVIDNVIEIEILVDDMENLFDPEETWWAGSFLITGDCINLPSDSDLINYIKIKRFKNNL